MGGGPGTHDGTSSWSDLNMRLESCDLLDLGECFLEPRNGGL